jgi:hypothetical protein
VRPFHTSSNSPSIKFDLTEKQCGDISMEFLYQAMRWTRFLPDMRSTWVLSRPRRLRCQEAVEVQVPSMILGGIALACYSVTV